MTSILFAARRIAAGLLMVVGLAGASACAQTGQALILGPTVLNGTNSMEAQAAQAVGLTPVVVDNATWMSMSTADFAKYQVIVVGDPACSADPGLATAATMTTSVWGPAVNGNVIINGTDPVFHAEYGGKAGGQTLVYKSVAFAGNQTGKTGLYVSLSCEYISAYSPTHVPVLDALNDGEFDVQQVGCYNAVHIVATHPALAGLTDADLSNWYCSVHEAFTKWPADFQVLAIAEGAGATYTAADGTTGIPYIIARGAGLVAISNISLSPLTGNDSAGGTQVLTATVTTNTPTAGTPVAGKSVTFKVTSGPDAGLESTATTDANGTASFSLKNGGGLGTDAVTATFVDNAGRTETSPSASVVFSYSNPPVFAASTPAAGFSVWAGNPVSFSVQASDVDPGDTVTLSAGSLPMGATVSGLPMTGNPAQGSFSWTPSQTQGGTYPIAFTAKDLGGHTSVYTVPVTVKIDTTPPVLVPTVTGPHGLNGWFTGPVNVSWSVTDPESGIASSTGCGNAVVSTSTSGTAFTCSATNGAGLSSSQSVTVQMTTQPPTVTPVVSGTLGANGWYTSAVAVSWNVSDPIAPVTTTCPVTNITADTAGQTVTCTATNAAGLSTTQTVTVKEDKTKPTLIGMPTTAACSLWPPNHRLVTVANVSASAGVSGLLPGSFQVTGTSSEANGPFGPNVVINGGTVQLRAERNGDGSGRIYTITATALNEAGATTTATSTCVVAHDQGN